MHVWKMSLRRTKRIVISWHGPWESQQNMQYDVQQLRLRSACAFTWNSSVYHFLNSMEYQWIWFNFPSWVLSQYKMRSISFSLFSRLNHDIIAFQHIAAHQQLSFLRSFLLHHTWPSFRYNGTATLIQHCEILHLSTINMSRLMTKPTKWLCTQQRLKSAWAYAQCDQSFCCPHE